MNRVLKMQKLKNQSERSSVAFSGGSCISSSC
ncbi:class III lanthipeptide [Exiguobacterium sp. NG55]